MARLVCHGLPGNVRQLRNIAPAWRMSNRGQDGAITPAVEHQLRNNQAHGVDLAAVDCQRAAAEGCELAGPGRSACVLGAIRSARQRASGAESKRRATMIEALRSNGWSPNRAAAAWTSRPARCTI